MQTVLEKLRQIGSAIIDPYFVVDPQLNIVDFNGAFFALFPRQVARRLKKSRCCEAFKLDICTHRCIGLEAMRKGQSIRYDEVSGIIAESGEQLRLIGSATPLYDEAGHPVAALVIYRNVTDEAKVQAKYKSMLEEASRERHELLERMQARTGELLEANTTIGRLEDALLLSRKGLWEPSSLELSPYSETVLDGWEPLAAAGTAATRRRGEPSTGGAAEEERTPSLGPLADAPRTAMPARTAAPVDGSELAPRRTQTPLIRSASSALAEKSAALLAADEQPPIEPAASPHPVDETTKPAVRAESKGQAPPAPAAPPAEVGQDWDWDWDEGVPSPVAARSPTAEAVLAAPNALVEEEDGEISIDAVDALEFHRLRSEAPVRQPTPRSQGMAALKRAVQDAVNRRTRSAEEEAEKAPAADSGSLPALPAAEPDAGSQPQPITVELVAVGREEE